jgi:hypothetical protein
MGYHSSPVLALIMSIFNIRLGAWFGNPGPAGDSTYTDLSPKRPFWHLLCETFGMTDDERPYVYLSDGGHFENLGLYEMVLRRCHCIVVSDAGADPDCALEDLGNAIRKIRIDLGISIEIEQFSVFSRKHSETKYCAFGKIKYCEVDGPEAENGMLIYIKPAIAGGEPIDVFNYKEESSVFPHESTSDQWFSESQFESYRALGKHIVDRMAAGAPVKKQEQSKEPATPPPNSLEAFVKRANEYLAAGFLNLPDLTQETLNPVVLVGKAAFADPTRQNALRSG